MGMGNGNGAWLLEYLNAWNSRIINYNANPCLRSQQQRQSVVWSAEKR